MGHDHGRLADLIATRNSGMGSLFPRCWPGGFLDRRDPLGSARIPLREMVTIDYLYVAHWSLWDDFKILLRTAGTVVGQRGR